MSHLGCAQRRLNRAIHLGVLRSGRAAGAAARDEVLRQCGRRCATAGAAAGAAAVLPSAGRVARPSISPPWCHGLLPANAHNMR